MRRLAAIALLAAGCAVQDQPGSTRTDSAGVELVAYAGPDRPLDWTFDRLFTIGGKDTGEESFYALSPGYVGADAAGNLYVLDRSAHRVVVFDSTGTALATLGRAGGGPGEIQRPFGLSVAADGTVGVVDLGKQALVRFDAAGQALPQEPFPPGYRGGGLRMVPGGLTLVVFDLTVRDDALVEHLIRVSGADTTPLVTLRHLPTRPIGRDHRVRSLRRHRNRRTGRPTAGGLPDRPAHRVALLDRRKPRTDSAGKEDLP
jgi:hypothetical protein